MLSKKWVVLAIVGTVLLAPEESQGGRRRNRQAGWYGGQGYYGPYQSGVGVPEGSYSNGNQYPNNSNYGPNASYNNSNPGTNVSPTPMNPGPTTSGIDANNPQQIRGDVEIINPPENATTFNYALNGQGYSIPAGQTQRITNDRQLIIEFQRGNRQQPARYTLSPGRFKFTQSNQGWELVRTSDQSSGQSVRTAKPPLPDNRTFDNTDGRSIDRRNDLDERNRPRRNRTQDDQNPENEQTPKESDDNSSDVPPAPQ